MVLVILVVQSVQTSHSHTVTSLRLRSERFFNEEDYIRLKDTYILNMDKLANAKKDMAILHPLPRVNEISVEVDDDPRAAYFRQALCGKYIRMALILNLLNIVKEVK